MNADLYIRSAGWFHRIDPRAKLGVMLLGVVALLLLREPLPLVAALLLIHAVALSTGVPAGPIVSAWRALLPVTLLILILSSVAWTAVPGEPLAQVGPFRVTAGTIANALALAARIDALAFVFLILMWTTEQGEMVAGLSRLGLSYGASLGVAITMQFVPLFGRIFEEISEAQQSRGLVMRRRNPIGTARAYLPVIVPLLITALRTVDNLSMALVARGYGASRPRSMRRQLAMRPADWLAVAAGVLMVAGALLLRA